MATETKTSPPPASSSTEQSSSTPSSSTASTTPNESSTASSADRRTPSEQARILFQLPSDLEQPQTPTIKGPLIDTSSLDHNQTNVKVEINELNDEEVEKLREWNRKRIENKLMGEYERVGKHVNQLISESLDTTLKLNSIQINGAKSTRTSFLSSLFEPYLPKSEQSQSLASILETTRDLTGLLSRFDIFKEIDVKLEQSPSLFAKPGDVDIVFDVKEQPKYFLRTATDVGDGEGNATATARIRNVLGGAETLEGNVSFGTRTKSAFQLRFDSPFLASPDSRIALSLASNHRDLSYYANCSEYTKGFKTDLKTLTRFGISELSYEAIVRQLSDILPRASMSIRQQAGTSLKSSLSHTLIRDTRDDLFLPTRGSYMKFKQEFAGLGGDISFFKTESESSISKSLSPNHVLSFGTRTGFLLPFGAKETNFLDRFHLGGPTSIRQFRQNSLGPKDNADYLGGDLTWSTGLSLISSIPTKEDWNLKFHTFVNAGKLIPFDRERKWDRMIKDLVKEPSVSVGLGLMYKHSIVRIEANLGVPLAMGKQEGGVKGLQFGLGLSFL